MIRQKEVKTAPERTQTLSVVNDFIHQRMDIVRHCKSTILFLGCHYKKIPEKTHREISHNTYDIGEYAGWSIYDKKTSYQYEKSENNIMVEDNGDGEYIHLLTDTTFAVKTVNTCAVFHSKYCSNADLRVPRDP